MITPFLFAAAETVGGSGLIGILIWLLIVACIIWVIFLIMGMFPIPEPLRTIIVVIIALVLLLVIVNRLGFIGVIQFSEQEFLPSDLPSNETETVVVVEV